MNPKLDRKEYVTVESYLFHLYNDLGYYDLEVAYNYIRKDNTTGFSKWVRFDLLMSLDYDDKVEGTFDTKRSFLDKITHRSVLDIEVILDIDSTPEGSVDPNDIKEYAKKVIKKIKERGFFGEYFFSGSKSVHASYLFPELRDLDNNARDRFKKAFIMRFKADAAKSSRRNMIALEGVPHWKTGVVKEELIYE